MRKFVKYNELTDVQKVHAKEQYIDIRNEEEQDVIENRDTSDELMMCLSFEIDTEDEGYIFVNI